MALSHSPRIGDFESDTVVLGSWVRAKPLFLGQRDSGDQIPGQVILSNVTMPEPKFSNNADREAHGRPGDIRSSNCGWCGERDGFPAERRTKRPLAGATDCHVYGRIGACSPGIIAAAGSCSGREMNEIRQRLPWRVPAHRRIELER